MSRSIICERFSSSVRSSMFAETHRLKKDTRLQHFYSKLKVDYATTGKREFDLNRKFMISIRSGHLHAGEVPGVRRSKIPEKIEVIGNPGFHCRQRPSDCLRLEMRASLKNPSGKMEFSRCRTEGSSPALSLFSSARREARFSASRDSRLNFSDGFMDGGWLVPFL